MRIVLVSLNAKFIHSNLALRYLRAAIEPEFTDVHLVELQSNDDLRKSAARVYELQPDVLGFSCYIWNIETTLALVRDLKQVLPDVRIVLGGPEVGPRACELLRQIPEIDFVVAGEGEAAFLALINQLKTGAENPNIPGVYTRLTTQPATGKAPMKALPVEQVPLAYRERDIDELRNKLVYVETSRGCPFRCAYCLSGNEHVRFFPLERVFAEVSTLINAGVPLVKFVDRTFNANPARAQQIMTWLLEHRGETRFHFEICADLLDEQFISFLSRVPAALFQFEIGVQSTDPVVLAAINRRMDFGKVAQSVKALRQLDNIHLHLDLIAGLPEQTWDSFALSFDDTISLRPHMLQLGFLKLLPGTHLRTAATEFGFRYSSLPPYEVLQSKWMRFDQLNKLHIIEQLVEYYYNSSLLAHTLPYLWQTESPFSLFDRLANDWLEKGMHLRSHGQETLFDMFQEFAPKTPLVSDLLQIDRARMLPSFPANFKLPAQYRTGWDEYLDAHLQEFSPRSFKQAFRTVFPVWLQTETLAYLGEHPKQVAVVDRDKKQLHGFTALSPSFS